MLKYKLITPTKVPSGHELLSSELTRCQNRLTTANFENGTDDHQIMIEEQEKVGDLIIFRGYEVVIKKVVGYINLKNKKDSKIKIDDHASSFELWSR